MQDQHAGGVRTQMSERAIEEYKIADEPYYLPVDNEVGLFEAAHAAHLPVILKGPTGCGKTRFVEHMAWRLERPLITVACHAGLNTDGGAEGYGYLPRLKKGKYGRISLLAAGAHEFEGLADSFEGLLKALAES